MSCVLRDPSPHLWRWQLLFSAAGAIALGVQTYLLREFLIVLQGDEVAVGLGLAAWFVGICVGAVAARRGTEGSARLVAPAAILSLGVLGCTAMWLARFGRRLVGIATGELLSLEPSLLLAMCLFVPPGVCVGTAFVALARTATARLGSASSAIGRLYVFESLGSLVAGVLVSFVLAVTLQPSKGLLLLVGVALFGAVPAAKADLIRGKRALLCLGSTCILIALTPGSHWLEQTTERGRFATLATNGSLVAAMNTPYQHLAVGGDDPRMLYANGQYVASLPDPTSNELLAHELMLLAHKPTTVLGFGGLETGLLRFCLRHPIERFDIVVLDSDAFRFVENHLAPEDRAALRDPRVHVIFDEPRRFLARAGQKYDLILSRDADPTTLLLARSTSIEFDRLVNARLAADGVYVVRFSAGANVQEGELGNLGASLFRTLHAVFPVVLSTPGPEAFFVAGKTREHMTLDPATLAARYRERRIDSDIFFPELLVELLPAERVATIQTEIERSARSSEIARDDRPVAFLHAMGVRQKIAGSAWASLLHYAARHPGWLSTAIVAPSLSLLLYRSLRRRGSAYKRVAAWHATAITGASGLAASLLVFTSFQTRVGALYSDIGALSGLFMVGLGAGGAVAMRARSSRPLLHAQWICLALAGVLVVGLELLDRASSARWLQWLTHVLLLFGAGFGTGLVFPSASRELLAAPGASSATPPASVAAGLEFWDHAGAALAALCSAILLIPILGLVRCAGVLVALQALGVFLTWWTQRSSAQTDPYPS